MQGNNCLLIKSAHVPHERLDITKVWLTHSVQKWFWHRYEKVWSNYMVYQILQCQEVKKKILLHVQGHNVPVPFSWQLRASSLVNHPEILMRKLPDLVTMNMTLERTGGLYLTAAARVAYVKGVAADCNQDAIYPTAQREISRTECDNIQTCIDKSGRIEERNKFIFSKTNRRTNFPNLFCQKLYMFRAVSLPIIRSFPLYLRHWYMSCRFDDSFQIRPGWSYLKAVIKICMTYTSAEFTVQNSWWWTEELPETCRDFWQNKLEN